MLLYKDVRFIRKPKTNTRVVFACDEVYFHNYGIDNLNSCLDTGQLAHCHIINPSSTTLKLIDNLDKNISISIENLDIVSLNKYQLKTYYYCARFFVAEDLFLNFNINELWVCDADIIFNKATTIPTDKKIGISYNPDQTHLWKKTQANLIYFHKDKQEFISKVIRKYLDRVSSTDFSILKNITDKYELGDLVGLDQVCMSEVLLEDYINDTSFINLHSIENLKSKHPTGADVWILIGNTKRNLRK